MSGLTAKRHKGLLSAARDTEDLHKQWRTALRQHEVRLEGQFKELERRLRPRAKGRQPKGLPSAKQAERVAALLAKARIKPAKGRGKDLRRVEQLLQALLADLPEAD